MPRPIDPSRDLLFGMLALQIGLIDQGQLVAAFQAWTRDKDRSLADHLVSRGDLDADDRVVVEPLVAQHLKKHGGDPEKSLAVIHAGRSTRESLAQIGDADVEAYLGQLGTACIADGEDPERTATYSVGTATADGQRFRVLRPHARGGLGAVFVALDSELNREVALKQILDRHADDPTCRGRFLLEAEITGGLEHPGVVPVYGLGSHDDGRPYYAMRFIRGDSLKEAIEQFHGDQDLKADPGRQSLELRKLLLRFLDVCNAIEYAHSRGVLHRDIKPGNIIVGKHGETLVVDWGLAKARGQSGAEESSGERLLVPSSASGSAETLPGSALGTPAYMSPEQAQGDLEHLGPRSDVYSLGATLYCLLTGRPPVEDDDIGAVLRAVQRGAFPPPRQINPAIDPAMGAVCLKAMALRPDDRYNSPKALADDVERWMADEPVIAWREPWARLARRWARRHQSLVAGAAALLVTGVVALAMGAVLIDRQKRRAEENLQFARTAVDDMYTQVAEKWLSEQPLMEELQRDFLLKALKFYDRFAGEPGGDPEVRREAAKAARRAGNIRRHLGQDRQAEDDYSRSIGLLSRLTSEAPTDSDNIEELASTHERLGWLFWMTGRLKESEAEYRLALNLVEPLADPRSLRVASRELLAKILNSLGVLLQANGRIEEAEVSYRRALELVEGLTAQDQGKVEHRKSVAYALAGLGSLLGQAQGRHEEAQRHLRQSIGIYEELSAAAPGRPDLRYYIFYPQRTLAIVLRETGRLGDAERLLTRSVTLSESLAAEYPLAHAARENLARAHSALAIYYYETGRAREAEEACKRELAIFEKLTRDHPSIHSYRHGLAYSHMMLGQISTRLGRTQEAEAAYHRALGLLDGLAGDYPDVTDYRIDLGLTLFRLADLEKLARRPGEAEEMYLRAIAVQERLTTELPSLPNAWRTLGILLADLCQHYQRTGRQEEADQLCRRVLAHAEAIPTEPNGKANASILKGLALGGMGDAALIRGDAAEARQFQEQAVDALRAVQEAHPGNTDGPRLFRKRIGALAWAELALGEYYDARRAIDRMIAVPVRLAVERYDAACYLARCLPALAARAARPDRPPGELVRSYADRAMTSLREAAQAGFVDVDHMRTDPDLDPLRTRLDFQLLMMDLAFPSDPFSKIADADR